MKRVKLGVIGCGDIAQSVLTLCKVTRGIKVTALCDINGEKLKKQSKRFKKAQTFLDYRELIAKGDCDAIYIALPHFLHYPVMLEAINYKKHIFCEKPITCNLNEGLKVVIEAEKAGVKIAINYQYRYDNNCYNAVMAARNGLLGNINFVRCYVPWSRQQKYFDNSPWHKEKGKAGGGTLITQGSHFLDIILWALQSNPKEIVSTCNNFKFKNYNIEDFCAVQINMRNSAVVQFASSMVEKVERTSILEIVGDKGSVVYTKGFGSKVKFYGIKDPGYKAGGMALHPVQRSLRSFINWVLNDTPHLCTGKDALNVLEVIENIYKEAKR